MHVQLGPVVLVLEVVQNLAGKGLLIRKVRSTCDWRGLGYKRLQRGRVDGMSQLCSYSRRRHRGGWARAVLADNWWCKLSHGGRSERKLLSCGRSEDL
jgi:hypothetical protein